MDAPSPADAPHFFPKEAHGPSRLPHGRKGSLSPPRDTGMKVKEKSGTVSGRPEGETPPCGIDTAETKSKKTKARRTCGDHALRRGSPV